MILREYPDMGITIEQEDLKLLDDLYWELGNYPEKIEYTTMEVVSCDEENCEIKFSILTKDEKDHSNRTTVTFSKDNIVKPIRVPTKLLCNSMINYFVKGELEAFDPISVYINRYMYFQTNMMPTAFALYGYGEVLDEVGNRIAFFSDMDIEEGVARLRNITNETVNASRIVFFDTEYKQMFTSNVNHQSYINTAKLRDAKVKIEKLEKLPEDSNIKCIADKELKEFKNINSYVEYYRNKEQENA